MQRVEMEKRTRRDEKRGAKKKAKGKIGRGERDWMSGERWEERCGERRTGNDRRRERGERERRKGREKRKIESGER